MSAYWNIKWLEDLEEAKTESAAGGKPILMFFHYTHCAGCINTFGKTLKGMAVTDAIHEGFVPALFETTQSPGLAKLYDVEWTPTFIVADETGAEAYRWVGYLPEDDFLSQMVMSLGRAAMKKGDFTRAKKYLDEVLIKYPLTDLAPEAMYYLGVVRYKETQDATWLTWAYDNLNETYPQSVWREKASVWSKEKLESAAKAA